jgi:hypothetical protein
MILPAWDIYAALFSTISASSSFTPNQHLGLGSMCVERWESPGDLNSVPMVVLFRGEGPNPFFGGEVSLLNGGEAACLWLPPAKYRVEVTLQPDIKTLENFSKNIFASEDVVLDTQNTKKIAVCMEYRHKVRAGPYKWSIVMGDGKCQ